MARRGRSGRSRPAPLPLRDGVDPTRVVLRADETPVTVQEALLANRSCAALNPQALRARVQQGEIVDADGRVVDLDGPARPNSVIYLYRDLPAETVVPFDMPILHRDDDLVVVDKPHFLATMPRGAHVTQTALVRLRRELGLHQLSPVHRLDRITAGVLMFTCRPQVRGAYQQLFAQRRISKSYRALAPIDPHIELPTEVCNRIEKRAGDLRATVESGKPNAHTTIDLLERMGDQTGVYRLTPHTGRTHQLRLHMAGLGIPIVGDPLYPEVTAVADDDFANPLQLLAYSLEFDDPITGRPRRFISQQRLDES